MNGIAFYLLLSLFDLFDFPQIKEEKYFIGKIEYTYTYESNKLNVDSLVEAKPEKGVFRFDHQNYQSSFIGKDTTTYFYFEKLNKCISKTNQKLNNDCEDYGIPTDSIISYKVYDTDEKVNGYSCRIIEYQSKYFWNRYYVSKDLRIAPNTYQKHLAYNWSFYGNKTDGGLILKLEHRFKNYTMKGIVKDLKKYDLGFKALEIDEQIIAERCNKK